MNVASKVCRIFHSSLQAHIIFHHQYHQMSAFYCTRIERQWYVLLKYILRLENTVLHICTVLLEAEWFEL